LLRIIPILLVFRGLYDFLFPVKRKKKEVPQTYGVFGCPLPHPHFLTPPFSQEKMKIEPNLIETYHKI
jgi:hypothetical protein